jgi:Fe-S-cluster containining protein
MKQYAVSEYGQHVAAEACNAARKATMAILASHKDEKIPVEISKVMYSQVDRFVKKAGSQEKWKCKKGCHYCCCVPVVVNSIEAVLIANHLEGLDHESQKAIEERLIKNNKYVKDFGMQKYADDRIKCAFVNIDGSCLIYQARPTACRKYGSYDVDNCIKSFESDDAHDMDSVDIDAHMAGTAYMDGVKDALKGRTATLKDGDINAMVLEKIQRSAS